MEMRSVQSSHLRAVGYDPAARSLHIEFTNGHIYEYRGVPEQFHKTLMGAKSIGNFFHQHVKPHFNGRRVK